MTQEITLYKRKKLARVGFANLPAVIDDAGPQARRRFVEFFVANIRNPNTRIAYARAVARFFNWCEDHNIALNKVEPILVAAYIEQHPGSAPSVKQHLAAIRMLFDYLVIGQVVPFNPAAAVRGPKHVVKRGKTPVLKAEQARALLDSINLKTIVGLRDHAILGVMCYTFARVGAVVVSDHRKTYFFGLSPTGHRSRQPRLWRGIGGNGSVQRLNRPQIEHRQRVGERRGAGELIVPPP